MARRKMTGTYNFFRPIFAAYDKMAFNYTAEPFEGEGPYLILSKHTNVLDMFFVPISFKEPIRFVSSEHVLRKPVLGPLVKLLAPPIVKQKGERDTTAVRNILRSLRSGEWVCLFPEGNTTFNGATGYISPATAKLLKTARTDVLLYQMEGGYLSSPRWANKVRKGQLKGHVAGIITKQQCEQLSLGELYDLIIKGLWGNDTPLDIRNTVPYIGKNYAEHVERAYFICPECKNLCTIESHGDSFECTACQHGGTVDEFGYIKGFTFESFYEWDMFQRDFIKSMPPIADDTLIFSDDSMQCRYVLTGSKTYHLGKKGTLALYGGHLDYSSERTGISFKIENIEDVALLEKQQLLVNADGKIFEFISKEVYSAVKYMYFILYLKQMREKGHFDGYWGI